MMIHFRLRMVTHESVKVVSAATGAVKAGACETSAAAGGFSFLSVYAKRGTSCTSAGSEVYFFLLAATGLRPADKPVLGLSHSEDCADIGREPIYSF
jgi:hypothetical protein